MIGNSFYIVYTRGLFANFIPFYRSAQSLLLIDTEDFSLLTTFLFFAKHKHLLKAVNSLSKNLIYELSEIARVVNNFYPLRNYSFL